MEVNHRVMGILESIGYTELRQAINLNMACVYSLIN